VSLWQDPDDVSHCRMLSLTKLNGGLSRLHSVDEDAVSWLTSYGSWHAYKKKKYFFHFSRILNGFWWSLWEVITHRLNGYILDVIGKGTAEQDMTEIRPMLTAVAVKSYRCWLLANQFTNFTVSDCLPRECQYGKHFQWKLDKCGGRGIIWPHAVFSSLVCIYHKLGHLF